MSNKPLTDLRIKKLKSNSSKRIELWDALLPGFGLRVSPVGTKSFILMYRFDGKQRRQTLGRYPLLSLSEARQQAQEILRKANSGEDPVDKPKMRQKKDSFSQVMEDFLTLHCQRFNKPSTQKSTRQLLTKEFLTVWENRSVRRIKKQDILAVLDAAVERGSPGTANHAYSAIAKFFNWCIERDIIEFNPCSDIKRPSKLGVRDRVLSDNELAAIWNSLDMQAYPFSDIVKLLMLTGQRRGEVLHMHWQHIHFKERYWSIPKNMTKSGRAHTIPLTDTVHDILSNIPKLHEHYLFPSHSQTDSFYSGFGKAKKCLDENSGVNNWTLHDLRRTAATSMAGLQIPPHVVEKVLNHSSGVFAGVAGVYNRFGYLPEMREALEKWDAHLKSLVGNNQATEINLK